MVLDIVKRLFFKKNKERPRMKEKNTTLRMTKNEAIKLYRKTNLPKPENPISFKTAEEECETCLVRPVCTDPCPKVLEIYRSHVVTDPNFNEIEHNRKYQKEYKEMWERINDSMDKRDMF